MNPEPNDSAENDQPVRPPQDAAQPGSPEVAASAAGDSPFQPVYGPHPQFVASNPQPASDEPDPVAESARGLIRFIYTSNPFYVISAVFVISGLRVTFENDTENFVAGAMAISLAVYSVLIAATAFMLIRFLRVWDDVRTLLVMMVLLFAGISIATDAVLSGDLQTGEIFCIAGFAFAVGTSETLLRGLRLRLRILFRIPYYLLLALIILYPILLGQMIHDPLQPRTEWTLFAFSPLAGAVLLTLMPAVRRGADYVRDNGSPSAWPWCPGALFVVLTVAVALRAYFLCDSFLMVGRMDTIFGPYFLVPLLLAANVLVMETAVTIRNRRMAEFAIALPLAACVLAMAGNGKGGVYGEFLHEFTMRLGATPLYLTLVATLGLYAWWTLRRLPAASEALTIGIASLCVVGPGTFGFASLDSPAALPLLAASVVQVALAAGRRDSMAAFTAAVLAAAAVLVAAHHTPFSAFALIAAWHVLLVGMLIVGLVFRDEFARNLQQLAAFAIFASGLAALVFGDRMLGTHSLFFGAAYTLVLALVAFAYHLLTGVGFYLVTAAFLLLATSASIVFSGYGLLARHLVGLPRLAWGLAFFLFALLISLSKSRHLRRGLLRSRRRRQRARSTP